MKATAIMALGLLGLAGGCLTDESGKHDASDADLGDVVDPDRQDATCQGPVKAPSACSAAAEQETPARGAGHVSWPTPIFYVDVPPSSGDHRPEWGRWGEYDYLPPQRWLHNLEHGGIAFLYDPCLDPAIVGALRDFARARPDDDGGAFRWVLTPYPGLPTVIAVVAWQHTWEAGCFDSARAAELTTFIDAHYRKAPEDFDGDGSFAQGWLGR